MLSAVRHSYGKAHHRDMGSIVTIGLFRRQNNLLEILQILGVC